MEQKLYQSGAGSSTVISRSQQIEGTLHGEGAVRIDGQVHGRIALQGTVTISSTGSVKGPTGADEVRVAGQVEGDITARRVRLERTCNVTGDISAVTLIMEDGARFNGCSKMRQPDPGEHPQRETETLPPVEELQFGKNYTADAAETI